MANTQYTFDVSGHEARITDGTGHTIIVQERGDGLAVNVKDDTIYRQYPDDVQLAASELGETTTQAIYDHLMGEFWRWADDCAQRHGFETVYQDGRSGGWLVIDGTRGISAAELAEPFETEPADPERAAQELADREAEDRTTDALEAPCAVCGNPAYAVISNTPTCDEHVDAVDTEHRDKVLACMFEIERSIDDDWRPQFFEQVKTRAAEPVQRHKLYVSDGVDPMAVSDPRSWDGNIDGKELTKRLSEVAATFEPGQRVTILVDTYELSRATVRAAAELERAGWDSPAGDLLDGLPPNAVMDRVRAMTDDEDERERAAAVLGPLEEAA